MTAAQLVGTVLDGKFRIDKTLASGASGDVYEALHLALGSRVAVKVLRPGVPQTGEVRRKRFLREARVAARIRSDHVVRVFDVVAPDRGPAYIVMEFLDGETLADRVRRVGALPIAEAVDFVLQAAKPLGEMHEAGIVHRDVKPSNIFLARDADDKERIKLLDFGVAAFQQPVARGESSLTLSEVLVGTPRYMAPEQVSSSKTVDARADVWALGVVLYEMLTGAQPFNGQTVLAVLSQIEQEEPRRVSELRPDVPAELAALVHRCLAKDPEGRPAHARALGEALASSMVEELAPSVAVVADVGRRRAVAAAVGVGAAILLVLAAVVAFRRGPESPAAATQAQATAASLPGAASVAATFTDAPPVASTSISAAAFPTVAPTPLASARPAASPARRPGGHPTRRATGRPPPGVRSSSDDDDRIE